MTPFLRPDEGGKMDRFHRLTSWSILTYVAPEVLVLTTFPEPGVDRVLRHSRKGHTFNDQ